MTNTSTQKSRKMESNMWLNSRRTARSRGYRRIYFREELFLENGRLTVWDGPNSRSVRLDKETLEEIV